MNKHFALIAFATLSLTGCAAASDTPLTLTKSAPIVDLDPTATTHQAAVEAPALKPIAIPVPVAVNVPAVEPQSSVPPVTQTNPPSASAQIEATSGVAPTTTRGAYLPGDGPDAVVPANLDDTPDVIPRAEPLNRMANRPYTVLGNNYVPLEVPGNYKERGTASWYGKKFHGQPTSTGEIYNMYAMTAAHPTLPIPSYARVTNLANNKSVIVRVNDRGPFLHGRIIDLSYTAAYKLRIIENGSAEVEVESLNAYDSASLSVSTNLASAVTTEPLPVESAPVAAPVQAVVVTPPPVVKAPTVTVTLGESVVATPAPSKLAGTIYLQLGAFKAPTGAESMMVSLRDKLDKNERPLSIFNKGGLARVQLGPYANEAQARATAEKLKAVLGFKPLLSKR